MRPNEGSLFMDFEMDLSACEIFKHIGVLVVEGRLPENKCGRKAGVHSWPLSRNSFKECCTNDLSKQANQLCSLVEKTRDKIDLAFNKKQIVNIDVICNQDETFIERLSIANSKSLNDYCLLEQWKIEIMRKSEESYRNTYSSTEMVFQAIRSFLHFSQLSAWWSKTNGANPRNIIFKISSCSSKLHFGSAPTVHTFPKLDISSFEYIQTTVHSLPRMELSYILSLIKKSKNELISNINTIPLQNSWFVDSLTPERTVADSFIGKRKDTNLDLYFSENSRSMFHMGIKNPKLDSNIENVKISNPETTTTSSESYKMDLDVTYTCNMQDRHNILTDLMQDFELGNNDQVIHFNKTKPNSECSYGNLLTNKVDQQTKGPKSRSKSVSPHFTSRFQAFSQDNSKTKPISARRLLMGGITTAEFNANTGLPLSSSPAPMKKIRKLSIGNCCEDFSTSNSSDEYIVLSKSAPASTSLLGNFEESVLKGRMPINRNLEGFRAELGASGSFCPKHVVLPIKVHYFQLSEDKSVPSPYLGHISLCDSLLPGRKYRVPKKGTVQLTVFNPNDTVVKMFIVLYNYTDMPPSSRTFLRQRIFSKRKDLKTLEDSQVLHYLVHLSFISSKHSRIYLHTDIQILFPQQTPDGQMFTITDGPTDPKYTPFAKYSSFSNDVYDQTNG
ncbi:atos homolog protein A isoform X2 [Hydra vulgaris]|uniref:Atos homolog protein A isoform X2 n=1 Tax=Hydra vulgaris TaxID=6087 RepID=A0ABM4CKP3_HYDVU